MNSGADFNAEVAACLARGAVPGAIGSDVNRRQAGFRPQQDIHRKTGRYQQGYALDLITFEVFMNPGRECHLTY